MAFKQAERLPTDGGVGVEHTEDGHLLIYVENPLGRQSITVSLYNAARIFAMLSLFLGINLPKAIAKAIKM